MLNRVNARERIFENQQDYMAFECVLAEAHGGIDTRLLSYSIMSSVRPRHGGQAQEGPITGPGGPGMLRHHDDGDLPLLVY